VLFERVVVDEVDDTGDSRRGIVDGCWDDAEFAADAHIVEVGIAAVERDAVLAERGDDGRGAGVSAVVDVFLECESHQEEGASSGDVICVIERFDDRVDDVVVHRVVDASGGEDELAVVAFFERAEQEVEWILREAVAAYEAGGESGWEVPFGACRGEDVIDVDAFGSRDA